MAVADWFHPPEIVEVNLDGWTGKAGEKIRVKAVDDVRVKQVSVVITDEQDAVLDAQREARRRRPMRCGGVYDDGGGGREPQGGCGGARFAGAHCEGDEAEVT